MQFKAVFIVVAFVATSVAQTFSMMEDSLDTKIKPDLMNFNATIQAFPMLGGGTAEQAMVGTIQFLVTHMTTLLIISYSFS